MSSSNDFSTITLNSDLKPLIDSFISNRHKDLEQIGTALGNNDVISIQTIAHKLAGNAGSYGFKELGLIGKNLEESCISNNWPEIEKYSALYAQYINNLVIEYS